MAANRTIHIVHIIEQLTLGGPLNAIVGAATHMREGIRHQVISLLPVQRRAGEIAAEKSILVHSAPDTARLNALLADADIVQLHFWNSPEIHDFMAGSLPAMRVVVWCHVNGRNPPHILPKSLFEFGDIVVATAPSSLDLPVFRAANPEAVALIPGGADFTRLADPRSRTHDGYQVGYIGSLDFCKLHASFMPMSAAIEVPGIHLLVCGSGRDRPELERQANALNAADRFSFLGFTEDIADILSRIDVFGYPLCEGNHSTGELAIQEAMYAGVPPVIFPFGGAAEIVAHGHSGIIVRNENEYSAAIARLYYMPSERKRLGENAAREARARFGAHKSGPAMERLYEKMMAGPKRERGSAAATQSQANNRGAWSLIRSLDGVGDTDFRCSLEPTSEDEAVAAEERIASVSAGMADIVLQYRLRHPDDPYLRLWVGLILRKRRRAIATAEFKASLALGCDYPRVHRYFRDELQLFSNSD